MRRIRRLTTAGSVTLPIMGLFSAMAIASFSLSSLTLEWKHRMETQLRLDRCVGEQAMRLVRLLDGVQNANRRIHALRVAIAAATIPAPETVPALKAVLKAQAVLQQASLWSWNFQRIRWFARGGCGERRDRAMPLPNPGYSRPPPDELGEQELRASDDAALRIEALHSPRVSAALVHRPEAEGGENEKTGEKTTAEFTRPRLF